MTLPYDKMAPYEKMIHDIKENKFIQNLEQGNAHPQGTHVGVTEDTLLERALEEYKSTSGFDNENDYTGCLEDTILSNKKIIEETIPQLTYKERFKIHGVFPDDQYNDPENPSEYKTRHTGFKASSDSKSGVVQEVSTNVCTAWLEQDGNSPYGVRLITFYPDLEVDPIAGSDVYKTNRDLEPLIKNHALYQNASDMGKVNYLTRVTTKSDDINLFFTPGRNNNTFNDKLIIKTGRRNCYESNIHMDNVRYKKPSGEYIRDPEEIKAVRRRFPDLAKVTDNAITFREQIFQEKQQRNLERQRRADALMSRMVSPTQETELELN